MTDDTDSVAEYVLLEFMMILESDRRRGVTVPLAEYLRRFPGREELIAREYVAATSGTASTAEKSPSEESDPNRIGPYRVLSEIGRGGQGVVFAAEDTRLGRRVALKVVKGSSAKSDDMIIRFKREATVLSRLDHPAISTIFEIDRYEGTTYIAMRLVEGQSLSERYRSRSGPPSTAAEVAFEIEIFEKAARALAYAHERGVVHRDIKPGNLMITRAGEPVILDFGLARDSVADSPTLTVPGEILGTPGFMSPEQYVGAVDLVDGRTDVFALGVTLYLAVTGRLPFEGPTNETIGHRICSVQQDDPRRLNPAVSRDLALCIETALEKDLARRYRSAADFADDLRRILQGEPIAARPPSVFIRLRRLARAHPAPFAASVVGIIAASTLIGVMWRNLSSEHRLNTDLSQRNQDIVTLNGNLERRNSEINALLDDLKPLRILRDVEDLLTEEDKLYPIAPASIDKMTAWLGRADELTREAPVVDGARKRIAVRTQGTSDAARYEFMFENLATRLGRLAERQTWISKCRDLAKLSGDKVRAASSTWDECIEDIANDPAFGGLRLKVQDGLVPLDVNNAGLWEFWLPASGTRPKWDDGRKTWKIDAETGVVLILLPGGMTRMGADRIPVAEADEVPPIDIKLGPFFISRYELTQAQWKRAREGKNPASFFPGTKHRINHAAFTFSEAHPVETIDFASTVATLARLGLILPTEAQWEYSARAGAKGMFAWEADQPTYEQLFRFANIAASDSYDAGDPQENAPTMPDGYPFTAPVGTFAPNRFGLHDVHGNVFEWCLDFHSTNYRDFRARPGDGYHDFDPIDLDRTVRGGSFETPLFHTRLTNRSRMNPTQSMADVGVRPVRGIDP